MKSEESIYEEVHLYLSEHCYQPDSTKLNKGLNVAVAKQQVIENGCILNVGDLFYSFAELQTKLNDYKSVECVEFWNEKLELLWLQRKGLKKS